MKKYQLLTVIVLAATIASPAVALEVKRSVTVSASPEETWKTIGDFCGIGNWHPAIAKCQLSTKGKDNLRTLTLTDGGIVVEKQLSRSDADHDYTYAIVNDSPIPVDHYKSTISVKKSGNGSMISWSSSFNAKGAPDQKAVDVIAGVLDTGLASLQERLGQ